MERKKEERKHDVTNEALQVKVIPESTSVELNERREQIYEYISSFRG
jgi:translation elongation factor EF-1beta